MRTTVLIVGLCGALVIAGAVAHSQTTTSSPPTLTISSTVPTDIPGGAANATLQQAAQFAWQEFFALNWPAKAGVRDTPDTTKLFGDQSGPLVWHTLRGKVEIFPGNGTKTQGPHGYNNKKPNPPDYGYDDPPQYVYRTSVGPCPSQTAPAQPAWINLDEITQIALDSMFAGVAPSGSTPVNSNPQLIRFMAKANRAQYAYVAGNQYWYGGTATAPVNKAKANFVAAIRANPPVAPTAPFIDFPDGTIEVKAAWRPLGPSEDPSRFHMTTVRYYEKSTQPCYREDRWALIALHIIQKTPSAPSFIYATFEQADNILLPAAGQNGKPVAVEDADGNVVNQPAPSTPTTPALTYQDSSTNPQVSIVGSTYCGSPGNQIFYRNTAGQTGVPTGGAICVNKRDNAIPSDVVAVNKAAHDAIRAYNAANNITSSPWLYYKLVNVQAYPFDKSTINTSDPNSPQNPSTFFQANIVVETNYTLQLFHGRVAANGAPTDFQAASVPPPPNVHVFGNNTVASYNMGGCMGCHGVAQTAGADFSFILNEGPVREPEFPQISMSTLKAKYALNPRKN